MAEEQVQDWEQYAVKKPQQQQTSNDEWDKYAVKKKADGNGLNNGIQPTSQSESQSSPFQNGINLSNNSFLKDISKQVTPELQERHNQILKRVDELNKPYENQTPVQKFDNMAAPILGFNRDITESLNPKKKAEIEHDANGHWGNIVQNVFANIEKAGTNIAKGVAQLGADYYGVGKPYSTDDPVTKLIAGLNGNEKRMDAVIANNPLPNTFLGNTTQSLANIAPDVIGAAVVPEAKIAQGAGLLSKAGKLLFNPFTNYLVGKGAITGYGKSREEGSTEGEAALQGLKGGYEGAKQGIELALLGAGSNAATSSIMKSAEKMGLTGAKGIATKQLVGLGTDLVAYSLLQPTANAAVEGRFPTMKEIADGAGIAAAFRIAGGVKELAQHSSLNKAIQETQNARNGAAISNFVDADHDAIQKVYEMPETAQELNLKALDAAKKAKETTDISKKQEYVAQAMTFTKASNVKTVTDEILNNPDAIEKIKNSDLPDEMKQQFIQKAQDINELLNKKPTEQPQEQPEKQPEIKESNITPIKIKGTEVYEHGEDDATANGKENGISPTKLTANGVNSAIEIGNRAKENGKTEIISSDVDRAKETAKIAADEANKGINEGTPMYEANAVKTSSTPLLNTLDIGKWEGEPSGSFPEKHYFENPDEVIDGTKDATAGKWEKQMEEAYKYAQEAPKDAQIITHSKVTRAFKALEKTDGKWTDETTKEFLRLGEKEQPKEEPIPSTEHKIGDEVTVTAADGTILGEKAKVTAISDDGKFIQTDLGDAYMPSEQILKNETTKDTPKQKEKSGEGLKDEKTGLVLYHGSPHSFENFDISKLGSGEGKQAFGHGLYFTNEEGIAKGYANKLSSKKNFWEALMGGNRISLSKEDFNFINKDLDALGYDGSRAENENIGEINVGDTVEHSPETLEALAVLFGKNAKSELENSGLSKEEIDRLLEIKKKISDPQLYKISAHKGKSASEYDYLNWSDKLTDSQRKKITDIELPENITGQDAYKELSKKLGSDQKASEYLLSKGIDGITYKSHKGTGGASGEGRNYVIFDPKSIIVDEINGQKPKNETTKDTPQQKEKSGEGLKDVTEEEKMQFGSGYKDYNFKKENIPTNKIKITEKPSLSERKELVEDIKNNGIKQPIVVEYDKDTDSYYVKNGNHRAAIAKELGIENIHSIIAEYKEPKIEKTKSETLINKISNKDIKSYLLENGFKENADGSFNRGELTLRIKNNLKLNDDSTYQKEDNSIIIDDIAVNKKSRNKGIGSMAMNNIIEYADNNNKKVYLEPMVNRSDSKMSKEQLVNFYKKFGFYTINDDVMVRYPQKTKNEITKDTNQTEAEKQQPEKVSEVSGTAETGKPKEYVTKNGKHKIVYDEKGNSKVINVKTGDEVSKPTAKKVINEAADNYDFSKGERAVVPENNEFKDEKEADNYIVEHTNNPVELAETYLRQKPEGKPLSTVEQMIADYGVGRVTSGSFNRHGDRNNKGFAMGKHYLDGKNAQPIDVVAKEMSDHYDVEITPQDIADFMTRFPNGESDALKKSENEVSYNAKQKFEKLTGLPLNKEIAEKAIDYEYNNLSAAEQKFFEQRFTTEHELEQEYWKQFGNTNAPKESISPETKQTEGAAAEPPTSGTNTATEGEIGRSELTGVTHAETDKIAREFGLGEYEANPETVAEWDAEADKRIKSNPDVVSELLAKLKKGEQPDKIEQRIMAKYLASLRAKLNIDPTSDKLIGAYKIAKDLSDKIGGREVAKSLVARKDLVPVEDTIGDLMVREMEALGVDKLTDKQKEDIVSDFNKIQEAKKETEAKLKILEEENARLKAEAELKKTTKSTTTQNKSKEYVAKVREDIKRSIKDKWEKASNDGTLTAVPVPYAKQLAAIAPDVAKLVKSYVEEGVTELKEVVKKVLDDIKEYIPEITEKDVHDLIAGNYNEKKKTRNELAAKLKDLKDEAVYINKLEKLLSGEEPKEEKKKIQRNQQIKELQDKIKEFKKGEAEANKFYGESETGNRKIEKMEDELQRLKDRKEKEPSTTVKKELSEKEIELKKQIDEERKAFNKEKPSDVKSLMAYRKRLEVQANKVQDAINKGEYEPEKKKQVNILEDKELQKKYPKQYKEALEAKDKLIKLKQEREIKFLKQQYANRSKSDKVKDAALEVINVPRALMSSFDFSAPLRQGIIPTIAHPELAFKAAKEMFKNAFSQKRFDRYFTNLRESNEFKVMEKSGLYIADPHDHKLSAKEEMFMNNLAEKIPYIGKIVAGSERAYVSYLNKMRADIFTKGASLLAESGKTPENSPEDYKGLASWVNNSTGRGGMSKGMENASPILNSIFFSPRLIASRLNILGLSDVASGGKGFYSKLPKEVRKMAAQDLVKFVGFGLTVLALAKLNGADVEDDPRSSDFGKIRVGDTRYDIWGGFQQYIRFITQLGTGEQKSSTSDRITELNGKDRFGKTRADVATAFLRGKLAPIPSMTWDFLQGRTAVGQKTDLGTEVLDHFTPLIRNDIQDAWKEQGAKSLFTIGLPATFGIGVQTYTSKPKSNAAGGAGAGGSWVRPK